MRTWIAIFVALAVLVAYQPVVHAKPPPAVASAAVTQAWQLYQDGNCRGAQNRLSDVLSLAPEWTPIYFDLGVSAERCGDAKLAASYYRQFASADPQQRIWVNERASLLEQQLSGAAAQPSDRAEPRKGFPWWGWVLIGAGAIVLAAAVATEVGSSEEP